MARVENTSDYSIWPLYMGAQSVDGGIETQLPERKKVFYPCRGLKVLHNLRLQCTPRTIFTRIMTASLAGKHESNEDGLGTEVV